MATRPSPTTIRRLFALSRNRCSFTGCSDPIVEPSAKTIVGEVCHIRSPKVNGPRHDPSLSSEQVHASENLLLLCRAHHKVIDAGANLTTYTVERLIDMKSAHEAEAQASPQTSLKLSQEILRALMESAAEPRVDDSVTMDFSGAQFRVGGEGGGFGGGGGGGGILTIIGMNRVPSEAELALHGQAGQTFGGGGGGGGAIRFEGRPSTEADREKGLRATAFLPVNSYHIEGLFGALGAAWTYMSVKTIPATITIRVIAVLELGVLEKGTLLRVEVQALNPRGSVVAADAFDVAVPDASDLTPKGLIGRALTVPVDEAGVWTLRLRSGNLILGEYDLELRAES